MTKLIIEQVAEQLGIKVNELDYDIYGMINYRCKHGIMHPIFNPMARFTFNVSKPRPLAPCHKECCKRFKDINIKIHAYGIEKKRIKKWK